MKLVELAGALSNRTDILRWQRLGQLRERALVHPTARSRRNEPTGLSNRPGTVWPFVRQILERHGVPMHPVDIWRAAEQEAERRYPRTTIRAALRNAIRRGEPNFTQLPDGRYKLGSR